MEHQKLRISLANSLNKAASDSKSIADRRTFLLGTACSVAGAIACSADATATENSDLPVTLAAKAGRDLFRVRIEMDTKGNVNVPDNPLVSRKSKQKLPIESDAVFDYEERYRRPEDADASSIVTAVERFFHDAKQTGRLNRNHHQSELRESVRQTIVRRESLPELIYGTDDYFRHDELDLLRLPVSSVAVDRLLPAKAVRIGDRHMPTRETMTELLNLTSVEASDIEVEVMSIDDVSAKLQFKGKVEGSVDGVPTRLQTIGKMTFDRALGTCTWLTMAIHETREISKAEPGFNVAATIKMIRKPLSAPIGLPAKPATIGFDGTVPRDRLYVEQISREVGVGMLMNRNWRMMGDVPGSTMLRMIENDRSIAQCDLKPLASLEPGRQLTLDAFQQDVTKSLGDQVTQLVEADERLSESGLRVLRVVADGAVEGIPIRWVSLHFSDDSGRRILATFTMDGDSIDEFAGSDVQLASTIRLLEPSEIKAESTEIASRGTDNPGQSSADVATNPPKKLETKVQSASDIR